MSTTRTAIRRRKEARQGRRKIVVPFKDARQTDKPKKGKK